MTASPAASDPSSSRPKATLGFQQKLKKLNPSASPEVGRPIAHGNHVRSFPQAETPLLRGVTTTNGHRRAPIAPQPRVRRLWRAAPSTGCLGQVFSKR
jgi:hypothetical protein